MAATWAWPRGTNAPSPTTCTSRSQRPQGFSVCSPSCSSLVWRLLRSVERSPVAKARSRTRSCPAPRTWLALGAILAAVIAFLGHGLFDYFFGFNPINGLWWALVGLALAAPVVMLPQAATSDVKVGFDATPLATRGAGVARYTLELLRALRDCTPEIELRAALQPATRRRRDCDRAGRCYPRSARRELPAARHGCRRPCPWRWRASTSTCATTRTSMRRLLSRTAGGRDAPRHVAAHDAGACTRARRVVVLTPVCAWRRGARAPSPARARAPRRDAIDVLALDPGKVHVIPWLVSPRISAARRPSGGRPVCASMDSSPATSFSRHDRAAQEPGPPRARASRSCVATASTASS